MRHVFARFFISLACLSVLIGSGRSCLSAEKTLLLDPTEEGLRSWESREFEGITTYQPISDNGKPAIKATSHRSASGLYKTIRIDIRKTPILRWSWKVIQFPSVFDEKTKSGDDFAVRVFILVNDGWFSWNTKSVTYVWSTQLPIDTTWPCVFTQNVTMKVVNTGMEQLGIWQHHQINLIEELETHLGKSIDHIDGLAIMTDSDNSGTSATAYYGEITVSSE